MELVVLVGLPGSGKTTYYRTHFAQTHVQVSKDLMKNARRRDSRQREMIEAALRDGKSVVVDNTNATPEIRAPLIALGRAHGARVVACYFDLPAAVAVARNRQREGKEKVPDVAIYVMRAKLKPPAVAEGFDEIRIIDTSLPTSQQTLFSS